LHELYTPALNHQEESPLSKALSEYLVAEKKIKSYSPKDPYEQEE
jgi:hypothetical protein